jgi:pilus assembly protein CpaB
MENSDTKTLWISVGCALFAVFLLYSWSQEQKASMHKKFGSKKQVVIAAKDIREMEPIDESMVEISDMPESFVQPQALQSPEVAIGQLAAAPIKKGEQILDTKLLLPGKDTGLSMQITPGKRAITIPIDTMRGIAKLIKPGDRIDLITALDSGQGMDKKKEIRTIMQDVPILATGQNIVDTVPAQLEEDGKDGYLLNNLRKVNNFDSITVEASPNEIQLLVVILSSNPASLFAVLRNPNDRYINPLKLVETDDVLGKVKAPRAPATPEPVKTAAPPPVKKKSGPYEDL